MKNKKRIEKGKLAYGPRPRGNMTPDRISNRGEIENPVEVGLKKVLGRSMASCKGMYGIATCQKLWDPRMKLLCTLTRIDYS
jgi:hypothetical protein